MLNLVEIGFHDGLAIASIPYLVTVSDLNDLAGQPVSPSPSIILCVTWSSVDTFRAATGERVVLGLHCPGWSACAVGLSPGPCWATSRNFPVLS